MNRSRRANTISFLYKILFAIIILAGTLDRAGIFTARLQPQTLFSFTAISNIFIMTITLFTAIKYVLPRKDLGPILAKVRYVGVVLILITGIVYHFILLPAKIEANPSYPVFTFGNIAAHYIAPVGMLMDWLLFDKKGAVTKREPLLCAAAPLLYFIAAMLYGHYGSTIPGKETAYAYFFLDVGALGIVGVLKWAAAIFVFILLLAYSVYLIDFFLARRMKTVENKGKE